MPVIWNSSRQIAFDDDGIRAPGAKAYFFEGNTLTPLTVYEDADLSVAHNIPLLADGNARWPRVFIPFSSTVNYDEQVTTADGVQLWYDQDIPRPDPVTSTPDTVPTEERVKTGMVHWEPIAGTKTGYVRCNAGTIGNGASGATERANADTSDLFTYLWNNLANGQAPVSGGRGGSAAADFAANKTITLLNLKGSTPFGLADMGGTDSSAATFPAQVPFSSGNSTTPGSSTGANTHVLSLAQLASVNPASYFSVKYDQTAVQSGAGTTVVTSITSVGAQTASLAAGSLGSSFGSDAPHNNVPFAVLGTWFIKL